MNTGENKSVKQEGNNESSSRWRSQEFRKSIVKKMMNIMIQKGCPSWAQNLSGLSKCVERFEEKVYTSAKDEVLISINFNKLCTILPYEELVSETVTVYLFIYFQDDYIAKISAKVQKLKSMYFTKFNALYRHVSSRLQKVESSQQPKAHDLENCRQIKKIIENIFAILGVSKSQINTDFKEKLDNAEKWIEYITQRINVSSYNQGQHSADVQSGQHFITSLSRTSQEEIFQKSQSPQLLQNYHLAKQISQPKKLSLREQPVAKQYSNPLLEANQMSMTKGPWNAVPQQAHGALKATEEFGIRINTPGISASPMLEDCSNLNETSHKPTVIADEPSAAMQCLVKVLTSMSAEALSTSIDEIREIVYLNGVIPASKLYGSSNRARKHTQSRLITQGRKMCSIGAVTLDTYHICDSTSDSLNQLNDAQEADFNSVASQGKRRRITENHALVEEIKETNKLLIDTEVVIGEKDSIQSAAEGAAESIIKPLWLLVPTSYPFSSPVILDKMSLEASEDLEDLWMIAKAKLRFSLQSMNQPWSLAEIAISWEHCARKAILEYAQHNGGGTFSSKYGGWEMC
ncbi:unnamed protein product [Lupinus luteus]|uniref:ARC105/Med15 mediator subunit C-terminal domain-containing protein n=1 Tax=Lupinus luteus TaxID=3873 RepID=A0AAV1YIK6_LUPLU